MKAHVTSNTCCLFGPKRSDILGVKCNFFIKFWEVHRVSYLFGNPLSSQCFSITVCHRFLSSWFPCFYILCHVSSAWRFARISLLFPDSVESWIILERNAKLNESSSFYLSLVMVKTEHLVRFSCLKTEQMYSSLKWENSFTNMVVFMAKGINTKSFLSCPFCHCCVVFIH